MEAKVKKVLCFLLIAVLLAVVGISFAGPDPLWKEHGDQAKKAQALKAQGDYLGAAEMHPYSLCKASYLWNYACSLIGKRDAKNNWCYDASKKANNADALKYLVQAEADINAPDEVSEGRCKGDDAVDLQRRINLVRDQINAHP